MSSEGGFPPVEEIQFPVIPDAVHAIQMERSRDNPDVDKIIGIISKDIGLSAEVLKLVNSAAFGLRVPQSSIPNAVMLLGMGRVVSCVTGVALRNTVGDKGMPRFWETANRVALASAALSMRLGSGAADLAFTIGLFHDCGIPVMKDYYPGYLEVLAEQNKLDGSTRLEHERFGIDHAKVGYLIAKSWNLPKTVIQVIRTHHHYLDILPHPDKLEDMVLELLTILKIAEFVTERTRNELSQASDTDNVYPEWAHIENGVLTFLEIERGELFEHIENVQEMLMQDAA